MFSMETLQVVLVGHAPDCVRLLPALTPPPSAPTTGTPTRYAPPVKTPMLESYVHKTVPQVIKKQGLLITRAQHAPVEPITLYGINTVANRGPIAPPASTSLQTAQAARAVYAAAALSGSIPPPPTLSLAPLGPIA